MKVAAIIPGPPFQIRAGACSCHLDVYVRDDNTRKWYRQEDGSRVANRGISGKLEAIYAQYQESNAGA